MPEAIPTDPPQTMGQRSFASAEYALNRKRTRREAFLADMDRVVLWNRLIALIEPLYPTSGRVGRQPIGVPRMLRMYCLQQWYALADEVLEDALYDSQALRDFVGIDLPRESVPDAATLLKFRRLLQANDLSRALFDEIDAHVAEKGKQWHFGMKARIGVDAQSGPVHTLIGTTANVYDGTQAGALLHGQEASALGDAGYRGVHKRPDAKGPEWLLALQSGKRKGLDLAEPWSRTLEKAKQIKASIRASVAHPFHVVKNLLRHRKVRYTGLAKNEAQLYKLFLLANL